jgi:hypothetical protein
MHRLRGPCPYDEEDTSKLKAAMWNTMNLPREGLQQPTRTRSRRSKEPKHTRAFPRLTTQASRGAQDFKIWGLPRTHMTEEMDLFPSLTVKRDCPPLPVVGSRAVSASALQPCCGSSIGGCIDDRSKTRTPHVRSDARATLITRFD